MTRKCNILAISTHPGMRREGGGMAKMPNFLISMVESSFETSPSASNSTGKGRVMLYRSKFDGVGAKISHHYCFSACGGGRTHAQNTSWKVVPFGEISVYRSDPRHVAKLTSRSDGLDVVSTARKRRWGEF